MSAESEISTIIRVPAVIAIFVLCISFLNWPIGFYTLLRIIVTGSAIYYAYKISDSKPDQGYWLWLFVIIAILFNPLIPVHIGDKSVWQVIDWLTAGYFALFAVVRLPKLSN